jgi:hypothetical protein
VSQRAVQTTYNLDFFADSCRDSGQRNASQNGLLFLLLEQCTTSNGYTFFSVKVTAWYTQPLCCILSNMVEPSPQNSHVSRVTSSRRPLLTRIGSPKFDLELFVPNKEHSHEVTALPLTCVVHNCLAEAEND